jgi:hypothetical protein
MKQEDRQYWYKLALEKNIPVSRAIPTGGGMDKSRSSRIILEGGAA